MDISILIVEEDDLIREALHGFVAAAFPRSRLIGAETEEEARVVAKTRLPDVIVVDVALAEWDGTKFIERLRSAAPDACIVAVTEETEDSCRAAACSAGATVSLPIWQIGDRLGQVLREVIEPDGEERRHKTVVCVEDDAEMIDLISLILRRHNFNTVSSLGGQRAVGTIRRVKPDIVLLDLMMPDVSGWEVYQQMKGDEKTRNIPIIVVTVIDPFLSRKQGLAPDDVEGYVVKPFLPRTLVREINRTLGVSSCRAMT